MTDDHKAKLIDREAGKAGFRGRINAKCIECIYDDHSAGTWRQQVENCTSPTCPLYPVRPLSEGKK